MGTEKSRNWTLRVNDKSHGPFTLAELQNFLASKKVTTTDVVSHPIVTNGIWVRLGTVISGEQVNPQAIVVAPPPVANSVRNPMNFRAIDERVAGVSSHSELLSAIEKIPPNRVRRSKSLSSTLLQLVLAVVCLGIGSMITALWSMSALTTERSVLRQQYAALETKLKTSEESLLLIRKQQEDERLKEAESQLTRSDVEKTMLQESEDQVKSLQSRVDQLSNDKITLESQLTDLQNKKVSPPIQEPVLQVMAEIKKNVNDAAGKLGLARTTPTILTAASVPNFAWNTSDPYLLVQVGVVVKNTTAKAISELSFHIQLKSQQRTVPVGEVVENMKIPGGIEPGEQKMLQISVRASNLGISKSDFSLRKLPEGTEVCVAIVEPEDFQIGEEFYEMFANVPHVVAPYTWVQRKDPFFESLLGR